MRKVLLIPVFALILGGTIGYLLRDFVSLKADENTAITTQKIEATDNAVNQIESNIAEAESYNLLPIVNEYEGGQ